MALPAFVIIYRIAPFRQLSLLSRSGIVPRAMRNILIAPSILAADFSSLGEAVVEIARAGADWVHLDVMDGVFVPNLTFGPKTVADLRGLSPLPFDVHLMTVNPGSLIDAFADAGADWITFHAEAEIHSHRVIQKIRSRGKKAGISICPGTDLSSIESLLPFVDLVLVMTVNPGFGGQTLIPECLEKVSALSAKAKEKGYGYLVSMDGGVNRDTISASLAAGPDVLVAGSAFFGSKDKAAEVRMLRGQTPV